MSRPPWVDRLDGDWGGGADDPPTELAEDNATIDELRAERVRLQQALDGLLAAVEPLMVEDVVQPYISAWELDADRVDSTGRDVNGERYFEALSVAYSAARGLSGGANQGDEA